MRSRSTKVVLAGALVSTCSVANAAVVYSVSALGNLGGTSTTPQAVNDSGAVAGYGTTAAGVTNAFVYTPGSGIQDIGTLTGSNGVSSQAFGINDAGTVVGGSVTASGARDAFIYTTGGTQSDVGNVNSPPASATNADGINATGEIVGTGTRSPGGNIGFVSNNGATLNTVGTAAAAGTTGPTSQLLAINANGLATGSSTISTGLVEAVDYDTNAGTFTTVIPNPAGTSGGAGRAINVLGEVAGISLNTSTFTNVSFAYTPSGGETVLGNLGANGTSAYGLNDSGFIVGGSNVSSTVTHGFIDTAGSPLTDLNSLIPAGSGWTLGTAYAISDTGDIVGIGTYNGVANQAYLLSPVPEPASFGILAFGGLLMIRRSRTKAKATEFPVAL